MLAKGESSAMKSRCVAANIAQCLCFALPKKKGLMQWCAKPFLIQSAAVKTASFMARS
jgi:hypothetical protein